MGFYIAFFLSFFKVGILSSIVITFNVGEAMHELRRRANS